MIRCSRLTRLRPGERVWLHGEETVVLSSRQEGEVLLYRLGNHHEVTPDLLSREGERYQASARIPRGTITRLASARLGWMDGERARVLGAVTAAPGGHRRYEVYVPAFHRTIIVDPRSLST